MRKSGVLTAVALMSLGLLGACTSLSESDRALIASANKNAEDAKTLAQQALDASRAAQSSAAAAAQAAQQASADAKAADEKADRIFQRTLRK
jgi:hypothetical protein